MLLAAMARAANDNKAHLWKCHYHHHAATTAQFPSENVKVSAVSTISGKCKNGS